MKKKGKKVSRWTGEKIPKEQEKKQRLEKLEKKNTLKRTEKFLKNLGEHLNTIK